MDPAGDPGQLDRQIFEAPQTARGFGEPGLVSPGGPALLEFDRTLPEQSAGAWWNLYNNVWGTNFPMWYGQDARFRFILDFAQFSED